MAIKILSQSHLSPTFPYMSIYMCTIIFETPGEKFEISTLKLNVIPLIAFDIDSTKGNIKDKPCHFRENTMGWNKNVRYIWVCSTNKKNLLHEYNPIDASLFVFGFTQFHTHIYLHIRSFIQPYVQCSSTFSGKHWKQAKKEKNRVKKNNKKKTFLLFFPSDWMYVMSNR